jgi:hypothetical protein
MAVWRAYPNRKEPAVGPPSASICHQSAARLRIKVASRRGDAAYFSKAIEVLARLRKFDRLVANPLTGSLLIAGESVDAGEIAGHALKHGLFRLEADRVEKRPIMRGMVRPVAQVDQALRGFTGGKIDLPSGIFLALLATGIYQIARGRFVVPPWYTAFWYAFGLITMFVVEKSVRENSPPVE